MQHMVETRNALLRKRSCEQKSVLEVCASEGREEAFWGNKKFLLVTGVIAAQVHTYENTHLACKIAIF